MKYDVEGYKVELQNIFARELSVKKLFDKAGYFSLYQKVPSTLSALVTITLMPLEIAKVVIGTGLSSRDI